MNLIGSIRKQYPEAPEIFVYDLGLFFSFRKQLAVLPGVTVITMPSFVPYWRACYTWKTYIFMHPLARFNLYLDAGTQVLRPLDDIFHAIEHQGYFAVSQEVPLNMITPVEFKSLFNISEDLYQKTCITAGVFGFAREGKITAVLEKVYAAAVAGLCLGFSDSPGEQWKNRGMNKSQFIRNCKLFRHDTTILSLVLRQEYGDFTPQDIRLYAGLSKHEDPHQAIWNLRLHYSQLDWAGTSLRIGAWRHINTGLVNSMVFMKRILNKLKSKH